jgi:hypothetical protein
MTEQSKGKSPIPKLELEKFTFSPPGPMGWSLSEYEKMINEGQTEIVPSTNSSFRPEINLEGKQIVELGLDESKIGADILELKVDSDAHIPSNRMDIDVDDDDEDEEEIKVKKKEKKKTKKNDDNYDEEEDLELGGDTEDDEVNSIVEVEFDLEPEPVKPKNKVTIVIEDQNLRKPWITPIIQRKNEK